MNSKKFNVVSNTTPFIALSSINQLRLLPKLFNRVTIAEAVKEEINADGLIKVPDPKELDWVNVKPNISDIRERLRPCHERITKTDREQTKNISFPRRYTS